MSSSPDNYCEFFFDNMDESTRRIVVLGKTGVGKSSLANTIFGEIVFNINHSPKSGTRECQAETKSVNGRRITLIDSPGFFDSERSEEDMKTEILKCITEFAPGPHVFLIVLKVDKFTEQEKNVITKLQQYLSEEALKYAAVVFTHGDQLPEEVKIEEFVKQSADLSNLVKRCGSRCHVIDNKYWKNNQQDEYRSNQFQVAELLNTIDKIIETNKGGYYTNEMLQAARRKIVKEKECNKLRLRKAVGVTTGALLGAFFGGANKLMNEARPTIPLVVGVVIGTAAGIAAGADVAGGGTAEAPTSVTSAVPTASEHQQ